MLDLSLEHLGVVVKETVAEPGREAELAERNRRVESGLVKMIEKVGDRMYWRYVIGSLVTDLLQTSTARFE
jgi:hypothetical protein